jgi:predicted secreted protein
MRPWFANTFVFSLVFLLFATMSEGMGMKPADTERAPAALLTKADNGKQVHLKTGGMIEIELSGPGATGYSWYLDELPAGITVVSQTTKADREKGRVGGPVSYIFRLRADKPGTSEIRALYYRPWEGKEKTIDRFSITLLVE